MNLLDAAFAAVYVATLLWVIWIYLGERQTRIGRHSARRGTA